MYQTIIIIFLALLAAVILFLSIAAKKVFDLAIDSRKSKLEDINIGDDEVTRYTYEKLKRNEIAFDGLPFEILHMKTVMMLSGERDLPKNVKCIIDDCGYTSVKDEFTYQIKQLMPKLPTKPVIFATNILNKTVAKYNFSEASALNQVKKTKVPIFFIHGSEDNYTPTEMAHQLYDACPSDKELWIAKGATHGRSYDVNPHEYIARITKFYTQYVK